MTDVRRISDGKQILKKYLEDVNMEKKRKVREIQIDVVGGCREVYEIINKNLEKCLIDIKWMRETCDLYQWRKDFFNFNLPLLQGSWFTNSYYINTMTYQITKNFEQVVDICCSNLYLNQNGNHGLYFEVKEDLNWRGIIDILVKATPIHVYSLLNDRGHLTRLQIITHQSLLGNGAINYAFEFDHLYPTY